MQISRSLVIFFAVVLCAHAQEDDEQEFTSLSGWNPSIRDKSDTCRSMANAIGEEKFCQLFDMCCRMGFDPLNGDKCQTIDKTCQGSSFASCIWKNCTEMVTTTTTTPAPTTGSYLNSAGLLAGVTSVGIALLFC